MSSYCIVLLMVCTLATLTISTSSSDHDYHNLRQSDLNKITANCAKVLEIPHILMMKYGNMEFPKDAKTVSFIECLLTRLEFYDKEAGFNVKNMAQQFAKVPNIEERLIGCKKELGEEARDVYTGFQCLLAGDPQAILRAFN